MSGDRYSGPGPIHLIRNVCDGCAVWCETGRFYEEGSSEEPADVTCRACLHAAEEYGEQAFVRLAQLALESVPPEERARLNEAGVRRLIDEDEP